MPTWRGALRRLRGTPPPVPGAERWRGLSRQSAQGVLDLVYELVLAREPDPTGTQSYLDGLRQGTITPQELAGWTVASGEWWSVTPFSGLGQSLHFSRMMFVRSLPPATRILDLGGTALGQRHRRPRADGLPLRHSRTSSSIDLPSEDRNDALPRSRPPTTVTQTAARARCSYRYHSMVGPVATTPTTRSISSTAASRIEHVPVEVADTVLVGGAPGAAAGGYLGLDTPNARVTRLQQPEFIDPDHEHEYTDAEMRAKLHAAGFEVAGAWGLNHAGPSLAAGHFDAAQVATARGLFHQIEDCYLLAYLCRVPA